PRRNRRLNVFGYHLAQLDRVSLFRTGVPATCRMMNGVSLRRVSFIWTCGKQLVAENRYVRSTLSDACEEFGPRSVHVPPASFHCMWQSRYYIFQPWMAWDCAQWGGIDRVQLASLNCERVDTRQQRLDRAKALCVRIHINSSVAA